MAGPAGGDTRIPARIDLRHVKTAEYMRTYIGPYRSAFHPVRAMKPRDLFLLEVLLAILGALTLALPASRNTELLGRMLMSWPGLR